ncbi:MAG: hypothetical protein ACKVIQ_05540, partial [Acidimicrobiales bacterium]
VLQSRRHAGSYRHEPLKHWSVEPLGHLAASGAGRLGGVTHIVGRSVQAESHRLILCHPVAVRNPGYSFTLAAATSKCAAPLLYRR